MSRPSSTDRPVRWLAVAGALVALGGCSLAGRAPEPAATAGLPPAEVTTRFDAAVARYAAGDEAAAEAGFRTLAAEHPEYAGPLLNLALIHARRGEEPEALAYLGAAADRCAQCGAVWNELGILRRREGRFADAERAYRRAIEAEPGFGLAYYNLAVLYDLYLQRPELALELYRQYLDGTPDPALSANVARWVTDLERRVSPPAKAARAGGPT
jgi:Flp pilus assembly protein TadD